MYIKCIQRHMFIEHYFYGIQSKTSLNENYLKNNQNNQKKLARLQNPTLI